MPGVSEASLRPQPGEPDKWEYERRYRRFVEDKRTERVDLAGLFDPKVWENRHWRRLPAELASLYAIRDYCRKHDSLGDLNRNDRVVLIHADNADAAYCADIILRVLRDKRLLDDVTIEEPAWTVPGLDPAKVNVFPQAIEQLWSFLLERMAGADEVHYLNLTGGYKALVIMCAMYGYQSGFRKARLFYLNEEAAGSGILVLGFDLGNRLSGGFGSIKTDYFDADSATLIHQGFAPGEL
mgnify:CR=1 FL=1